MNLIFTSFQNADLRPKSEFVLIFFLLLTRKIMGFFKNSLIPTWILKCFWGGSLEDFLDLKGCLRPSFYIINMYIKKKMNL